MPSSETIITLHSSLRNCVVVKCLCPLSYGKKFLHLGKGTISTRWKTGLQLSGQGASHSGHLRMQRHFVVKIVATISGLDKDLPDLQKEQVNLASELQSNELQSISSQPSVDDLKETNPKEYKRRLLISKANKGKESWNKGKKHSPETIARIRKRTREAMQDPKVRKKLEKCAHPHSEETKMKIRMSVRRVIEKRHKEKQLKKQLQETYLHKWKESVAEAARLGGDGEDELQWDGYEILKEKMHQEAIKAKYQKISEAIKAKWADPEFRQRNLQGRFKKGNRKEK